MSATTPDNDHSGARRPFRKFTGPCNVWDSPLNGKVLGENWHLLSLDEKRQAIIARGWASDWSDACSILSKHGHAVRAMRARKKKLREEREARGR